MEVAYQSLRGYPYHDRHVTIWLWLDERLSLKEVDDWRSEEWLSLRVEAVMSPVWGAGS